MSDYHFYKRLESAVEKHTLTREQARKEAASGGVTTETRTRLLDTSRMVGVRENQLAHMYRAIRRNMSPYLSLLAIRYEGGKTKARAVPLDFKEELRVRHMLFEQSNQKKR